MSRTYRKDRNGKCFEEGNPLDKRKVRYSCRCEYCTGVEKKELENKIVDRDMNKQIKEYYRGDLAG